MQSHESRNDAVNDHGDTQGAAPHDADPVCAETVRQLYAYLDEVLDDATRGVIGSHLRDCPGCKERVDFEYSLMIHIRQRSKEEPIPEDLQRRLLECFDVDVSDDTRRNGD